MHIISNSLDWNSIENDLIIRSVGLRYSDDILKLILNIRIKNTLLSKAEVSARRGNSSKAAELVASINDDIELI